MFSINLNIDNKIISFFIFKYRKTYFVTDNNDNIYFEVNSPVFNQNIIQRLIRYLTGKTSEVEEKKVRYGSFTEIPLYF